MGSSCEGDALILFRLLGFSVNSFDRPPQRGAVGPVVYALNEFSPRSYGKQPSIASLGATSRLSSNQLEDDGSSVCVLSVSGPISLLEVDVGSVLGRR